MKKQAKINSHPDISVTEIAMTLLSILAMAGALLLAFAELDLETKRLLFTIDTIICFIFITYWFYGFFHTSEKKAFVKHRWIDLIASVPAIEPLRYARFFQILRVVRTVRMSHRLLKKVINTREITMISLLIFIIAILSISSIMILLIEGNLPNANIDTAEEAIWWALVTISTVGYGDYYPVTTAGRFFGSLLILCGVSFFGILSGFMASLFMSPSKEPDQVQEKLLAQLEEITQQQQKLMKKMTALERSLSITQKGQ